jgi:hypothetical protein
LKIENLRLVIGQRMRGPNLQSGGGTGIPQFAIFNFQFAIFNLGTAHTWGFNLPALRLSRRPQAALFAG